MISYTATMDKTVTLTVYKNKKQLLDKHKKEIPKFI